MSNVEIVKYDEPVTNPFIRVSIDVNTGVDLSATLSSFGSPAYKFRHYSVKTIEMTDETHDLAAGALLPFDNKRIAFHAPDCHFYLTANHDNTIVLFTDSTPKLKRVWLWIMLEKVEKVNVLS
jgi:hypothetical protein